VAASPCGALRVVGERTARAWIGGGSVPVRRGQRLGDVGAGAEAGIGEPARLQRLEGMLVRLGSLRLDENRLAPIQPQPAKVLIDAVNELAPRARLVEILDPQQGLPAACLRARMALDGAIGMAKVKPPGRRRREAGDEHFNRYRKDS